MQQALSTVAGKLWDPLFVSSGVASHAKAHAEMVSLVFVFGFAVFATKVAIASDALASEVMPPQVWTSDWLPSVGRVAACCAEDLAVGLGCLLVAAILFCWPASPLGRSLLRLLVYGCSAAALFWLGINARVFVEMRDFISARHLELSGGFRMEKSIVDSATGLVYVALVLLPLVTIAVHLWLIWAFPRFWQRAARCLCRPVLLVALSAGLFLFAREVRSGTFFDTPRDFAENPHLLLARSCFDHMDFGDGENSGIDPSEFQPGHHHLSHLPLDKRPKNIVLIVLESLSAQYLDLHGGPWPVTPNLRRLEAKGIVFDNHYATVNYSIASALPLLASIHNDTRTLSTVVAFPEFPVPFASTWLKKQGYKTYFLGSGGERCWEGYRNMAPAFVANGQFDVSRDKGHPFWQKNANPIRFWTDEYNDRATFDDAKRVLHDARDGKFLLVVWNYDTHWPYYPEDKTTTFDEQHFPRAARADEKRRERFVDYLRSIRDVDALIADFYAELEKLGLAEDTLVVVTGDHGEAWGQHGITFHGWSLYEEELRVPLVLLHPPLAKHGTRSKTIGSHIDLWPTIVDICGLPADPRWQGRSLFGSDPDDERRAYFYGVNNMLGLRQGKHKYIWDGRTRTDLLFDLDTDAGETVNLAAQHAELCEQLRRRVLAWAGYQTRLTRERLAP